MKKILAVLLILCCALPAVAKKRQSEEIITPLTQLEKRQFQTRVYPAQDSVIAMKALLNVLQDEGFIVYNVNSLLGYIYGVKDFDRSDPNIDISKEFGVTKSRLSYNGVNVATLEIGANITSYGDTSRVRVNFKRKLLNEYGNAQMIDDIDDVQYYDEFYKKVDSAIALQKQIQQKIKIEKPASVKKPLPRPKPVIKRPIPADIENTESADIQDNEVLLNSVSDKTDKKSDIYETQNTDNTSEDKQISEDNINVKTEDKENIKTNKENVIEEENADEKEDNTEIISKKEQKKELKEAKKRAKEEAKQAKIDAKQAKIEAKQAEKEARKAEKEAKREARRNAKQIQE